VNLMLQAHSEMIVRALIALPLATAMGAVLAFRPRRRGTPVRSSAVVQTQIILAVVGAVVMLIVGANLARAFGIVGAANLIRYRAKIDDPKDAVVMLATLSLGLACGVDLYGLAAFATVFILAVLWVIESFEPEQRKRFELKITGRIRRCCAATSRRCCGSTKRSTSCAAPGRRSCATRSTCGSRPAPIGLRTRSCCCSPEAKWKSSGTKRRRSR
jgi:hypothetical protein